MFEKIKNYALQTFYIKTKPKIEPKYKQQKDVYEYVFSKEDLKKLNELKNTKDVLAYKQDLLLKNKFEIRKVVK